MIMPRILKALCFLLPLAMGVLLPLAMAWPAATDIVGVPYVIDGDSLEIKGVQIRLFGIDAPEGRQTCINGSNKSWRCGRSAAHALFSRIGRRPVRCEPRDTDSYGRKVSVCFQGTTDLNRWMVENGWALAYRHYSGAYIDAENLARTHHAGIWSSHFEEPWIWRESHRDHHR